MEWHEWHPFILEDFWPLFAGPAVDVDWLPVHVHQPHHLLLVEAGLGPGAHLRAHQYNILLQMSDLTTLLTTYAANSGNVGIKLSRSSVRNLFFICRAIANLLGWKSGVWGSLASLSWQWTQLAQLSSKWGGHQESGDEPLYRVPHHQERGPRPQEALPPLAGQCGEPLAHHLGQPTTNQRGALWSRDLGSSNQSSPGGSWPCSCCWAAAGASPTCSRRSSMLVLLVTTSLHFAIPWSSHNT